MLQAEYGDEYLLIDDDRADRGNDGYLQSEKRIFAGHCFKRVQNQKIDKEITDKMVSDFNKALVLKQQGDRWDIEAWTFLSNYPISEGIAASIVARGKANSIDVSWRGPEYFAGMLQKHKYVREQFPNLMGDETMSQFVDGRITWICPTFDTGGEYGKLHKMKRKDSSFSRSIGPSNRLNLDTLWYSPPVSLLVMPTSELIEELALSDALQSM